MSNVFVTIGGIGSRMKAISPIDKHLLYYKDKRIIEWIYELYPNAKAIGSKKTKSRKETLLEVRGETDCIIIDCDIIPFFIEPYTFVEDTIVVFQTNKNKYGSVIIEDGRVVSVSEREHISNYKCSGMYYVKSIDRLLERMTDENSLASGMVGAETIMENTFVRLGDVEDYFLAL